MDPLSVSASIVALLQLTSTILGYLSDVKEGPKELQRIRLEISSVLTILIMLQDQADQSEENDSFSSTLRSLNMPDGPFTQFHATMERLSSKLAPVEGWRKIRKAFKWQIEKEEIYEILNIIERHKSLFSLARQNDHIALSKAIGVEIETIQKGFNEIGLGVTNLRIDRRQNEIRQWLSAPDPSSNYNKALNDRYANTGDWFLTTNAYSNWLSMPGSFLWLYGIPGCGKTILSSTIIQNTMAYCRHRTNSTVLYFYFDFNDVEKQRQEKMIRSLIIQLFSQCVCIPQALESLYSSCMNGESQPLYSSLLAILRQMMGQLEETYLIIDALDECLERQELLASIQELIGWKNRNLHILTTSRREKDIEDSMDSFNNNQGRICLQSILVSNDIRVYIHDRLQTDPTLRRWQKQPKVQQEIEDTLMGKADGMFRWAACQLDSLKNCMNLPGLRKALASLPKTLYDTYARILCNIDADQHQYAFKILQWLAYSARPLKLAEVAEVIAIGVEERPRFDPGVRLSEPRDILTLCSSLISLEDETVKDIQDDSNTVVVKLAHFSVKEYLSSNAILQGKLKIYSIQEISANVSICNDCLAYLLEFDGLNSLTPQFFAEYPLARYAARFWVQHAQVAERDSSFNPSLVIELLLTSGCGFLNWISLYDPNHRGLEPNVARSSNSLLPPLYYASMAGLYKIARVLLDKGADVNASDGWYGNALQAASLKGHYHVIQLLLEKGADVNAPGCLEYGDALQAASFGGHKQVVQILLEKGADVNAPGGRYGRALQAASFHGHGQVVRVLLEKGADVNAPGGRYGRALQAASSQGHDHVVQMLLENGADVNAIGERCTNAIQAALKGGHDKVVKLLLNNGASRVQVNVGRSTTKLKQQL